MILRAAANNLYQFPQYFRFLREKTYKDCNYFNMMVMTKKGQIYLTWIMLLLLIALIIWFIKKKLEGS